MGNVKNETGNRYGRLTVIKEADRSNKRARWLCQCDCGNKVVVIGKNLRNGNTKSCGCLNRELFLKSSITHGLSKHSLYSRWKSIKGRCYTESHTSYPYYGAIGIRVCPEWRHSFPAFLSWCLRNGWQTGLEIDRKDNKGDYCPQNCHFVSHRDNVLNQRLLRITNKSGYQGVGCHNETGRFTSYITINKKQQYLGFFATAKEAAIVRDKYIIANNITHEYKLQILNNGDK